LRKSRYDRTSSTSRHYQHSAAAITERLCPAPAAGTQARAAA
jgi:hypothetical protein